MASVESSAGHENSDGLVSCRCAADKCKLPSIILTIKSLLIRFYVLNACDNISVQDFFDYLEGVTCLDDLTTEDSVTLKT